MFHPEEAGSYGIPVHVDLNGRIRPGTSGNIYGCFLGVSVTDEGGLHCVRQILLPK